MTYQQTWDMNRVFSGGSHSEAFAEELERLQKWSTEFKEEVEAWDAERAADLIDLLEKYERTRRHLLEAFTFAGGLSSANVRDEKAAQLLNELALLASTLGTAKLFLDKKLAQVSQDVWNEWLQEPFLNERAFPLNEARTQAERLLSEDEEALISRLSVDGFHAWDDLYTDLVSLIKISFDEGEDATVYSAGQAENLLSTGDDPAVREERLATWEAAWEEMAPAFSRTLNHLAGFRLTDYDIHGRTHYMDKPLEYNRMQAKTLDTMWETISKNKEKLVEYFNRKAELFGRQQLGWLDVGAGVEVGDFTAKKYSYEEAADFIVDNFAPFSPKMSEMARQAFDERWIEAEDRPGKRSGGYCADLPVSGQSRIFMTFSGTADNVSTLAHELGHAFHSHVMRDLPLLNQNYAMNVAETASTLAELIVGDATIQSANSAEEKINLLDSKIINGVVMMTNIHARYLFERSFYDERQRGLVSSERLSELMLNAQKEAFADALSSYHPMFWASKLHFYSTGVPFYNFPYTFGYMFSQGIYAYAQEVGGNFEDKYIDLLRDTASMTTEELAQKHLQVDLTQPDFWQSAIDLLHADIDEFLNLTEEYVK